MVTFRQARPVPATVATNAPRRSSRVSVLSRAGAVIAARRSNE
jgi:hypothetical protein